MEISILIARIACVVYLSAAVGGFVRADFYKRIVDDMFANSALTYMTGFTAVVLGSLIVYLHNLWVGDWRLLITVIGWAALIKGVAIMALPGFVGRISAPIVAGMGGRLFPAVAFIIGILFGWFGFVA
jgi:hypothetical protein